MCDLQKLSYEVLNRLFDIDNLHQREPLAVVCLSNLMCVQDAWLFLLYLCLFSATF